MCLTWRAVGLLLVVPWLAGCMTRPEIRLDTGQGPQRLFTPPSAEPPPVQVRPEEARPSNSSLELPWALPSAGHHMALEPRSWPSRSDNLTIWDSITLFP